MTGPQNEELRVEALLASALNARLQSRLPAAMETVQRWCSTPGWGLFARVAVGTRAELRDGAPRSGE